MTTAIVGQTQTWVLSRATNYTVTLPGDVPAEGWIICAISQSTISATGANFNVSGWTAIMAPTAINGRYQSLFAKKLTAGMSSFTITWPTTSTAARIAVVYGTGGGPETWTVGSAETRQSYGSAPRYWCRAPSITAPGDGLAVMVAYEVTNALEATAPTVDNGFTVKSYQAQSQASIDICSIWIGEKAVSSGAVGITTVTWPNPQDSNGLGVQFFMPATAAPTTTGSGLSAIDGSGDEIKVFCTNDSGSIITPNALSILPLGYRSVDQMLEQPEFYWAHRGGSASYPEHSLWAYTQSVARGFGALECSLGRTSDGVWVGLHDADINRTSGLAAGTQPAISSMTWAQVQAFNITIGASGAPKPYMRIEELLDAYGNSHVLILDVKYAGSFIVELMNKLQTFYGSDAEANKHIIIKAYGVGSTSFRNTVNARGYKTWGYFYPTDAANFVTDAPKWDILGMAYTAAQSDWDALAAAGPGKPIVAHICPDQASIATGRARGAKGFQCSGVAVIKPTLAFEYKPYAQVEISAWYPEYPPGASVITNDEASEYSLGQMFNITASGTITHVYYYHEGDLTTRQVFLWDYFSNELLWSGTHEDTTGWNVVPITPIHVNAGRRVMPAYRKPFGTNMWYVARLNYPWPVSKNGIEAVASGRFNTNYQLMPDSSYQNSSYFADLRFVPDP